MCGPVGKETKRDIGKATTYFMRTHLSPSSWPQWPLSSIAKLKLGLVRVSMSWVELETRELIMAKQFTDCVPDLR